MSKSHHYCQYKGCYNHHIGSKIVKMYTGIMSGIQEILVFGCTKHLKEKYK